jgi:hypothetical protein
MILVQIVAQKVGVHAKFRLGEEIVRPVADEERADHQVADVSRARRPLHRPLILHEEQGFNVGGEGI